MFYFDKNYVQFLFILDQLASLRRQRDLLYFCCLEFVQIGYQDNRDQ